MIADLNEFGAFTDDIYIYIYIYHPIKTKDELLKLFDSSTINYWNYGDVWKKSYDDKEYEGGWQYDPKTKYLHVSKPKMERNIRLL